MRGDRIITNSLKTDWKPPKPDFKGNELLVPIKLWPIEIGGTLKLHRRDDVRFLKDSPVCRFS